MQMEDYVYEVQVPMEDVVEIKNGQRKLVNRVRIPGVTCSCVWTSTRTRGRSCVTPRVSPDSWATPTTPMPAALQRGVQHAQVAHAGRGEFPRRQGLDRGRASPAARVLPAEIDFEVGETITIKEGSFAGLPGSISEIKAESGKLIVLVALFERETPVELSLDRPAKLLLSLRATSRAGCRRLSERGRCVVAAAPGLAEHPHAVSSQF